MGKKFSGVSQTMSRFRGWIQAGATLLTNLHLPNFLKGGLYQGAGEDRLRAGAELLLLSGGRPGPAPSGRFRRWWGLPSSASPYYITGFLILLGVLLGALYLRLSMSLRLVSGAAAQNPH